MPKDRPTRRQLLTAAAAAGAGVPLAKLALGDSAHAAPPPPPLPPPGVDRSAPPHAAMVGHETPAPGGPHHLDALLYPPAPLPHQPGRVREYTLAPRDRRI